MLVEGGVTLGGAEEPGFSAIVFGVSGYLRLILWESTGGNS